MTDVRDEAEEFQPTSLFGSILEPGSSLNPIFLLVVDGTLASLFAILVTLAVLTQGNIHLIFLIFIELALWASVKWFVHEWNTMESNNGTTPVDLKLKSD